MKKSLLAVLMVAVLGSALTFVGCSADKDLDDYQNEQATKEAAKYAPAAGDWSGIVKSKATQQDLGAIQLHLEVQTGVAQSVTTGTASAPQAMLVGNIQYQGAAAMRVDIQSATFDPNAQQLTVIIPITLANGATQNLSLTASLSGSSFTGVIDSSGNDDMDGVFTLTKNGGTPAAVLTKMMSQASVSKLPGSSDDIVYSGKTTFTNNGDKRSVLVVISQPETVQQQFANLFSPLQLAQVSFNYGDSVIINYQNVQWDTKNQVIKGENGTLMSANSSDATTGPTQNVGAGIPSQAASASSSSAATAVNLTLTCSVTAASIQCNHSSNELADIADTSASLLGPGQSADDIKSDPTEDAQRAVREVAYKGTVKMPASDDPEQDVTLDVVYPARTRQTDIMDLFSPEADETVQATLIFMDNVQVYFGQTSWDEKSRTLDGAMTIVDGTTGDTFNSTLQCQGFSFNSASAKNLSCQYINNARGIMPMTGFAVTTGNLSSSVVPPTVSN